MDGGMPGQLEKEKYEVKNIYWICRKDDEEEEKKHEK